MPSRHSALARGELEITDAHPVPDQRGHTVSPHVSAAVKDTGRLDDILERTA